MGVGSALNLDVLLFSASQWTVILGILFVGLAVHAGLVTWLHRDVKSMGSPPLGWTIAAALLYIPTLLVWWAVRPRIPASSRDPRSVARTANASGVRSDAYRNPDPYGVGLEAPVNVPRPQWEDARDALGETGNSIGGTGRSTALQYAAAPPIITCTDCGARNTLDAAFRGESACHDCGTPLR